MDGWYWRIGQRGCRLGKRAAFALSCHCLPLCRKLDDIDVIFDSTVNDIDVIFSDGANVHETIMTTIYDVAKEAGVSPKTVSRVINRDSNVRPKTTEAVAAAIRKLGYVPSNAARMMRSNRSGIVGMITGALSHNLEYQQPTGLPDLHIVQGIQQVFSQSDKTLMIADTGGSAEAIDRLIDQFLQYRVEALIYVADYHQRVDIAQGRLECPMILVNCYDRNGTPSVLPDDEACQHGLVRDLIAKGHHRIAYLTLNETMDATPLRLKGYRRALEEAGIAYDPDIVTPGNSEIHFDDGPRLHQALDRLLAHSQPPSVICCGNDEMALRLYGLLRSRGVSIPSDIGVVGFDNYQRISETLYPQLTTVELPYTAMGRLAATSLLAAIEEAKPLNASPVRLAGSTFWRQSVASLHTSSVSKGEL